MSAPRPTSAAVACFEKREQHALAGIVRRGADQCLCQRILSECLRAILISNICYNIATVNSLQKNFANDTSNFDRSATSCVATWAVSRKRSKSGNL